MRSLKLTPLLHDCGVFNLQLPLYSFVQSLFKQFGALVSLVFAGVESLMMQLVFKHVELCILVVCFLLQHNTISEESITAFKRKETEEVVFFQLSERLSYVGNRTFVVEDAAEGFVEHEHNAASLYVVL